MSEREKRRYRVAICRSVYNYIEVEAEGEYEAREKASDIFDGEGYDRSLSAVAGVGEDYDAIVVGS